MSNLTLALIKPDAFERGLVGEIIGRIERERFELVAVRLLDPNETRGGTVGNPGVGWSPRTFYARQHDGAAYYEALVAFMERGPSLALVIRRENAIAHWRAVMGSWKERDITTIRGLLMRAGDPPMFNLVHGSDSAQMFEHEICVLESEGLVP